MLILMKKVFLIILILSIASCKDEQTVDFKKLAELDVKLSLPLEGEWLYDHPEKGQTFEEYTKSNPVTISDEEQYIYLQPIGEFTPMEKKMVDLNREYIELFFGLKTIILKPISEEKIPKENRRMFYGNEQLNSAFIIDKVLPPLKPEDGVVIMAITAKDLYPAPSWNYVFGQADYKNKTGVTSMFRYMEEHFSKDKYSLSLGRIIKTSTHEIGHMFSMKHCTHALCLMNGSNSLSEDDTKPTTLCSECLAKLSWNLKWNNSTRFKKLILFLKKHHLDKETDILEKQLEIIIKYKYEFFK